MNRSLLLIPAFFIWSLVSAQTPDWSKNVAPLLYAHCTTCHHSGGIAPFPLITYSDAYSHASLIVSDITGGVMPPWPPDTSFQRSVHERILSAADANTIIAWANGGKPLGNITQAPSQPVYNSSSTLDTVNLSIVIPTYTVSGSGDVYRNFPIPSGLTQSMYVTAIEVIPGNAAIVHHVLLYQDSTTAPATLDANDPGPGYTDAGGTGSNASVLLNGWAPGSSPYYTPVGTGFRLPANTNFVVQVHYPNGSQGQTDSTRINLKLTSVAQRNIAVSPILNYISDMTNGPISIAANTTKTYYEKYTVPNNSPVTALAVFPHMHLIGQQIKSWGNKPTTGDTIPFISIPKWNFHWQGMYPFQNAIHVPGGTTLQAEAYYDNTANNPNNPNSPPQTVTAGEATTNEMMIVFFAYLPYQNGDTNIIIDSRVIPQGATTLCSGQSVTLQTIIGAHYTYQWYKDGSIIAGATAASYAAAQAGNYYVKITLGPNSTFSNTVAVSSSGAPTASVTPSGNTSLCSEASLTLNAGSGTGYTYQWYSDTLPVSGATTASYSVSTAGTYSVVVYNGCYARSSNVVVTTGTTPSATVTPTGSTTFCLGGSVSLSAPSGLSYLWSSGATTQSITASQPATYTVTVTNSGNCSAVSSGTTVTVNALPSATVTNSGTTSFCVGQHAVLTGPSNLTYYWSNAATTQSITITNTGNYTLTVTNSNSCSAVSTPLAITVNSLPPVTITPGGATNFCPGGSVTLSATVNSTYLWSNNATTRSITASQTGNYIVTVTDANACSNTATVAVQAYALPDTSLTTNKPTTICPGDSVAISAAAGLSYHWSNGLTSETIEAKTNGNYNVTVTDTHACSAVSLPLTVTVSNNATASITATGATTFCTGGSVQLTASNGASYEWSNGASSQSITVSSAGNYLVTVTMSGSCIAISAPKVVVVNQAPAAPTITASGATTFCSGNNVSLSAPAGYTYLWNNNLQTQSIQVNSSGSYTVTITDANSCSASSSALSVVVNPLPTVPTITSSGATTFCTGGNVSLSAPAGYTYLWNNNLQTQSIQVNSSGSFTVTVIDANSCSASSSALNVVVNPLPVVAINGGGQTVCSNLAPFALSGGSPAGGAYSGNGVSSNTFDPSAATVGNNTITYTFTDNSGCVNTATESIVVNVCDGINELSQSYIMLAPNPSDGNFYVDWSKGDVAVEQVAIYDLQGRLIYTEMVTATGKQLVSLNNTAAGSYLVQLKTTEGFIYRKITVQ